LVRGIVDGVWGGGNWGGLKRCGKKVRGTVIHKQQIRSWAGIESGLGSGVLCKKGVLKNVGIAQQADTHKAGISGDTGGRPAKGNGIKFRRVRQKHRASGK